MSHLPHRRGTVLRARSALRAAVDGSRFVAGGSATAAFTSPSQLDFWPQSRSTLIGKADAGLAPATDFNDRARKSPFEVGAYETVGHAANPGWKVGPGFKQTGRGDSVPPLAPTSLRSQ